MVNVAKKVDQEAVRFCESCDDVSLYTGCFYPFNGDSTKYYSAFKNWGQTRTWSFLKIFRIIVGQIILIFKIAQLDEPKKRAGKAILKNSIFWPKIILKISRNEVS